MKSFWHLPIPAEATAVQFKLLPPIDITLQQGRTQEFIEAWARYKANKKFLE
jgi:hypothetical protein